jgi:chaperonin GroEL (HSP60 family)
MNKNIDALEENVMIAKAIADVLKTTLGPKGMDKMLIDAIGDVVITNDGATIIKEVELKHPAAKVIGEVAKALEEEVGDGTTTSIVLTGELLKQALNLRKQGLHQTTIIKGYELANNHSLKILEEKSFIIDIKKDEELKKVINTALTGKSIGKTKQVISEIVLKAFRKVKNINDIKIEKKRGQSITNSTLIDGVLLDREPVFSEMNKKIDNARIILIDSPLEVRTLETDSEIEIKAPEQLGSFKDKEQEGLKKLVQKIIESGANLVLCQKGIDEEAQAMMANKGITALRRIRRIDMELLSKALGVNIITNIKDLKKSDVSLASMNTERIGDEVMTIIYNCNNPRAVTILLRGAQEKLLDEINRSIEDALGDIKTVINNNKAVLGAGACELMLRRELLSYAKSISGKEQLGVIAFAKALEIIPRSLIENCGGLMVDVMADLIKKHEESNYWGTSEKAINAKSNGVIEPLELKKQVIKSAYEASKMILRIDDMILKQKK